MKNTVKNFCKKLNEKEYALVVVSYEGIIAELAFNADITTVTDIEYWFNFSKLNEGEHLVRYTRENGKLFGQLLAKDSMSEWFEVEE